ncbi:hypothetical protein [Leeia sp.]|uniref:hypothetical protein n=1 Tax=Leeia sp. TaxID=2884678 RepID=UPI0035B18E6A
MTARTSHSLNESTGKVMPSADSKVAELSAFQEGEASLLPGMTVLVPLVTAERFAALMGVEQGVVLGWVNKGYVPTMKIGKRCLINLAVLHRRALDADVCKH